MCNPLLPTIATVEEIIVESSDVKTLRVRPQTPINHLPGQCAMLSIFGVGEAIFSISSPPGQELLDFSIKAVGTLTNWLHQVDIGQELGIRGPYGNSFPVLALEGKNLLFIGGGIGLAPLRSVLKYALDHRAKFGDLQLIYGARSPGDLIFREEIFSTWPDIENIKVDLTVDGASPDWQGAVGFVPQRLKELAPNSANTVAITCGPPIMIKFVLQTLEELGFGDDQVITTLEYKMKCGVGKCGRCNIDEKYVCKDGPVFYLRKLKQFKGEF